jgi:polar amino acid transport system substrate-binding protein
MGQLLSGVCIQRLEQVVVNLIQNACQALRARDEAVHVSTSYDRKSQHVNITVSDKGMGIVEEDLLRIKDPFFTTKREAGGTGLGLSISSAIINEHSGRLEIDSLKGEGTTASIILPVAGR